MRFLPLRHISSPCSHFFPMLVLIRGQMPPNPANPQNKQESLLVNFPTLIPQNKAAREGIMEKLLLGLGSGGGDKHDKAQRMDPLGIDAPKSPLDSGTLKSKSL